MRESPRVRANRANAQRSTGPKSATGKAALRRNALKHALSVPIERMTGHHLQIEQLATRIAGKNPTKEHYGCAYQIASAVIDLRRIQKARFRLLQDPAERVKEPSIGKVNWAMRRMVAPGQRKAAEEDDAEVNGIFARFEGHKPGGGEYSLEEGFAVLALKLERLDRYERRAFTRFRKALRLLDLHCLEIAKPPG
jgi:hypothetical protein